MPGSQGSGPGSVGAGSGRRQSSTAAMSACGVEFATGGGCVQVEEWVLTGLGRQGEQVCPQGRPGRLAGEFGDDLVGSAVEHLNDLGSEELLGRHLKAVGVALDGVEQPGSRVAEFSQQRGG